MVLQINNCRSSEKPVTVVGSSVLIRMPFPTERISQSEAFSGGPLAAILGGGRFVWLSSKCSKAQLRLNSFSSLWISVLGARKERVEKKRDRRGGKRKRES